MKKRKLYEKPSMKVQELKQRRMLLAGSVEANRSGYGAANNQNWDEEE